MKDKYEFIVLSIFPDSILALLDNGIFKRAIQRDYLNIKVVNLRKYTSTLYRSIDCKPYGGGAGMLLNINVLYSAIKQYYTNNSIVLFLDPGGYNLSYIHSRKLLLESNNLKYKTTILVCGAYEGFDSRIFKYFKSIKVSIGDYILSNGVYPSIIVMDFLIRRINNIIGNKESLENESFENGLLEQDQYTKPRTFLNSKVPSILQNGNHNIIKKYNYISSLKNTIKYRSDLIEDANLSIENIEDLINIIEDVSFYDKK